MIRTRSVSGKRARHAARCAPGIIRIAAFAVGIGLPFMCPGETFGRTISGAGSRDCRAFIAAVERDSPTAIDSYVSWAQGFLSGINAANGQGINVSIDHAGLFHWLAGYCASHPDTSVHEALGELAGLQ